MEEKEIRYSEDGKSMLIIGKPLQAPEPTPQRKSETAEDVEESREIESSKKIVQVLNDHWLSEDESDTLSDDEIIERFPDEWSLGMDMFKAGAQWQSQQHPLITGKTLQEIKDELAKRCHYDYKDWTEMVKVLSEDDVVDIILDRADEANRIFYASQPFNPWVKTLVGMPQINQKLLIKISDRLIFVAYYKGHDTFITSEGSEVYHSNQITHWMPLPTEPKD